MIGDTTMSNIKDVQVSYGSIKAIYASGLAHYRRFDMRYTFMYAFHTYITTYFIFWVDINDYILTYTYTYDNCDGHSIKIDEYIWENFLTQYYNGYEKKEYELAMKHQGLTQKTLEENIIKVAGI